MTDKKWYKAVRLDRTSHYDQVTLWRVGKIVRPSDGRTPVHGGSCGEGSIHCSPTLLDTVSYQQGASRYYEVLPQGERIGGDGTKSRFPSVLVKRELTKGEIDVLAGFKLYEANHPYNPLLHKAKRLSEEYMRDRIARWDSVWDSVGDPVWVSSWVSVWDSVRASVRPSVWDSVWDSVGVSVWDSVWDSVGVSVWDSVRASVGASVVVSLWAYVGGLFPGIKTWTYAENLGSDPWRPLLDLWYAGYVPSFDGKTWRLHAGEKAQIVHSWTVEELSK